MKHMPHVRLWLGLAMALGTASLNATVDPATAWNWEDLSRTPKTWAWQGPFNGEVRPIWIEGVPFRGRQTRCFAFFGIPAQASPSNSVPGIVLVHGGMGTAYSEWVRQWVQRGYAAVAVDTCGALPVRGEGVHDWLRSPYGGPSSGTKLTAIDEPLSDQWVYHAVAAVVRSHSFLRAQPGVAADRIGITGISWGGVLTCIVAALDSRLAYAVPVYGCGFNAEAGGLVAGKPASAKWAALWDPAVYLPFAHCPMLWVDGTNDFAFSLDRVRRSAACAKGEQSFSVYLRMPHGQVEGAAPREILAFADHFARGGRALVRITETRCTKDSLSVRFAANGRKVVRAELLWTDDGSAVAWANRQWQSRVLDNFDPTSGAVSVAWPANACQAVVNLVTDDGLISSTSVLSR